MIVVEEGSAMCAGVIMASTSACMPSGSRTKHVSMHARLQPHAHMHGASVGGHVAVPMRGYA
eukprot:360308-Chlamydomonas_euryale.AAC.3